MGSGECAFFPEDTSQFFPTLKNLAFMAMCTFSSSTSQTLDGTQNYRSKWWGTCLSQRYFTILPNFEEFSLDGYVHI
jgi:hypothetical protein